MSERRRVVIAGGTSRLGRALQERLAAAHDVTVVGTRASVAAGTWAADLLSVADTEVALAGADVVVFLARASGPRARLLQGSADDLDLLMADSVARAVKLTKPSRLVFFGCGEQDEREACLRASGVPVAVLSGGGDDPLSQLERLVTSPTVETVRLGAWKGSGDEALPWSGPSTVLSVQRMPLTREWTARAAADAYFEGLVHDLPGLATVVGVEAIEVKTSGVSALRLRRATGRCEPDLEVLEVRDGALVAAGSTATFEFRVLAAPRVLMTTLRGFVPALPWLVYRGSQALLHARSMKRFAARLAG